jgi:hypothetical protein
MMKKYLIISFLYGLACVNIMVKAKKKVDGNKKENKVEKKEVVKII